MSAKTLNKMKKNLPPERRPSLKKLRRAKGISQKDFARKCGLARSTMWRLENGLDNPTLATIATLADVLGLSVGTIADALYEYYGEDLC